MTVKNCESTGVIDLKKVVLGMTCVDPVELTDVNVAYGLDGLDIV